MPKLRREDEPSSHSGYGTLLTAREIEIIRLAGAGLTNDEIGKRLFIAGTTVKTHLRKASFKVGVGNRTALVLWLLAQDIKNDAFDLDSTLAQFEKYGCYVRVQDTRDESESNLETVYQWPNDGISGT